MIQYTILYQQWKNYSTNVKVRKVLYVMQDYKHKIITIPNIMSMLRIAIIPVIVWLYCFKHMDKWAAALLALSGFTDLIDGFIARRFNMISNFGKALDPVADKLTQFIMLICLLTRFPMMLLPCILLFGKELISAITAMLAIRKTGRVEGADWHGKVTTCLLYAMMMIHIIWFDISAIASNTLIAICTAMMLLSFVLYNIRNIKAAKKAV